MTDRGSEFCGNPERHEYELYLAVEDIDHSRTKTKSPQTNGICERFHKTVKNVLFLRWRGERYIPKNVFFLCEEVLIYDAPESATFPRMFFSFARRF